MSWKDQALEKLEAERASAQYDRYARIMKDRICETLADFCRQDEEFAQAVVQGGSFAECMAVVAKGCGSSLSDIEAYRRAAAFYFRGAEVKMELRIRLEPEAEEAGKVIHLDFSDFFS